MRRQRYRRKTKNSYNKLNRSFQTASKALRVANQIKKLLNVEYKVHEQDLALTPGISPGTVTYLTGIGVGTDENTRNGDSIRVTGINIPYDVVINSSANNTICRIVVVRDNNSNGGAGAVANTPTWTGVNGVFDDNGFRSRRNLDNTKRFTVLYDRIHNLHQDSNQEVHIVRKYLKMNNVVEYVSTASGTTGAGNGALWLLAVSNEATNHPIITMRTRLRYIDN